MNKGKIQINDNLNEINISNEIVLIKGNRMPAVDAWYKIAEDNLFSAMCLLENKHVNHAVFFIQQCVECIVKGVFLESGILNAEKIKCISHNTLDAFKILYKKIGYEQGLEYCRQIPEWLNNKSSFEDKLILGASLANQFIRYFKDYIVEFKSRIISSDSSKYKNVMTEYYVVEKCFFQNILLLFSCLFTHKVEQEARYFTTKNDLIVLPNDIFSTNKISEGLPTFIEALKTLINYFTRNLEK